MVDVMAGALAANLYCETKTEKAWDLHDHEAIIPALDYLPLDFIQLREKKAPIMFKSLLFGFLSLSIQTETVG